MEPARKLWNQPGSSARKLWNQPGNYGTSLVPSLVPRLSPQKTGRAWDRGYLVPRLTHQLLIMDCHGNFAPGDQNSRNNGPPGHFFSRKLILVGLGILVRVPELRFLILYQSSSLHCATCSFASLGCLEAVKQTSTAMRVFIACGVHQLERQSVPSRERTWQPMSRSSSRI